MTQDLVEHQEPLASLDPKDPLEEWACQVTWMRSPRLRDIYAVHMGADELSADWHCPLGRGRAWEPRL